MWIVLSALYSFSLYFFIHDSPDKQWKSWLWWGSWWFECWTRYAAGVYINVSGCYTSGEPSHYILHKEATKSKQDLSNTKLNPTRATTYSLMQRRSMCSLFCLSRTLAKVLGQFCVLIWFVCIQQNVFQATLCERPHQKIWKQCVYSVSAWNFSVKNFPSS